MLLLLDRSLAMCLQSVKESLDASKLLSIKSFGGKESGHAKSYGGVLYSQ